MRDSVVPELRRRLANAHSVCAALGLTKGALRQGNGLLVCCPAHGDRSPSCSVTPGPDGTLRVHCFGCSELSGDVLHLIAARLGLDVQSEFPSVLTAAADMAGIPLDDPAPRKVLPMKPAPVVALPERAYPAFADVAALWKVSVRVGDCPEAVAMLERRGLVWEYVEGLGCVRALPPHCDAALPPWARFRGIPWWSAGYRVVVAMVDALGAVRSARAWHIGEPADAPKRVPPVGCRATGLVLADGPARAILKAAGRPAFRTDADPLRLVIAEGEPDFLTCATQWSDAAERSPGVLGIVSGSWSNELAQRIPEGTEVAIWTDADEAGERYAHAIAATLGHCRVSRGGAA